MPRTLLRLGQLLLIVAMFAAGGGHWAVLQTIAWSGMVLEYSTASGLSAGVEKTFDGRHPCRLCKVIEKQKSSEQKSAAHQTVSKWEFLPAIAATWVLPVRASELWSSVDCFAERRAEPPSVPPPRCA